MVRLRQRWRACPRKWPGVKERKTAMRIKGAFYYMGLLMICATGVKAALSSEVRGVVLDPNGSPIRAAHVTLTPKTSRYSQVDKTNDDGEFLFIGVASGEYVAVSYTHLRAHE